MGQLDQLANIQGDRIPVFFEIKIEYLYLKSDGVADNVRSTDEDDGSACSKSEHS